MDVVKTASFLFELISVTTKVGFVSSGLDFRIFPSSVRDIHFLCNE
jgi:hypothetical protein